MATVIPRERKDGRISYSIRASDGFRVNGDRVRPSTTWVPEHGWSEKKIEKELARQVKLFEDSVKAGTSQDSNIKFQTFAEQFIHDYAERKLKIKTVSEYEKFLKRIFPAIGHIRLRDLKPGHLNALYSNLSEDGMNLKTGGKLSSTSIHSYHRVVSTVLSKAVKKSGKTQTVKLAGTTGKRQMVVYLQTNTGV